MDRLNNTIESFSRELKDIEEEEDITHLYSPVENDRLKKIFSKLHSNFVNLFELLNERLPTTDNEAHFWAEPSRKLIKNIQKSMELKELLNDSEYAFSIDGSYNDIFYKCMEFLSVSGGSTIPANTKKIEIFYTIPIFKINDTLTIIKKDISTHMNLKLIGNGSYAEVYKYKDEFYDEYFALKRAKKQLNGEEIERFRNEYLEMKKYKSPYIVQVFRYDSLKEEYVMEYMDDDLLNYINRNNSKLSMNQRKRICYQITQGFAYLHSKSHLHRDISPKNILLKKYDSEIIFKISDFGLLKMPESNTTRMDTEVKGYFNDPSLHTEGFKNYSIEHEIYALTRLFIFVLTGRINLDRIIKSPSNTHLNTIVQKGLCIDKSKRFKNIYELYDSIRNL